jgi:hypothetical protein
LHDGAHITANFGQAEFCYKLDNVEENTAGHVIQEADREVQVADNADEAEIHEKGDITGDDNEV